MMTTSKNDLPTDYEALRDILIAVRYMCVKRMAFPIITCNIEQRNEFLVLSKSTFHAHPKNYLANCREPTTEQNGRWLLSVFTRIAQHFGLHPIIIESARYREPLISRFFAANEPDRSYKRVYGARGCGALSEIDRPLVYTLNGVIYDGIQIRSQEAEALQSRERSRYSD